MTALPSEKLVYACAPDGLELTGALVGDPAGTLIVVTHASTGRFSDRLYIELGRALAPQGVAVLSTDTRGHDIAALGLIEGEPKAIGGAFERFTESINDVATWLRFARQLTPQKLIIAGHSMGAAKAVRAITAPDSTVVDGLILLSPAVHWRPNVERIELAGRLVSAGRGDELMPPHPDGPPWNLISAATLDQRARLVEDVFTGPDNPWSTLDTAALVAFGGTEDGVVEELATLTAGWTGRTALTCHTIEGAGHDYRGYEALLGQAIDRWLHP